MATSTADIGTARQTASKDSSVSGSTARAARSPAASAATAGSASVKATAQSTVSATHRPISPAPTTRRFIPALPVAVSKGVRWGYSHVSPKRYCIFARIRTLMSKSIRVDDDTHAALASLKGKDETFDELLS